MATLHVKQHDRATITTSGSSQIFRNPGGRRHLLIVDVATAPTGTTPVVVFEIDTSTDGVTFTRKGAALANISAIGTQTTRYGVGTTQGQIVEPYLKIVWTVTGTTPSFTNLTSTFSAVDC